MNTRTESGARYALLLTDVFTREARAIALGSKDPATVNAALGPALENLTDGRNDYVLTTDKGAELSSARGGHARAGGAPDQAGPERYRNSGPFDANA